MKARAAKTSRLVSALAVIGLIAISTLMAVLLNSVALFSSFPSNAGNGGNSLLQNNGKYGELQIQLLTTENQSDIFAPPVSVGEPLNGESIVIVQDTNTSNPFNEGISTQYPGIASTYLDPGAYFVKFDYRTLRVSIPVNVTAENSTNLTVNINENAYPLVYSEQSGLTLAVAGVESGMYLQVRTTQPVATANQPVLLYIDNGTSSGQSFDANVVSIRPPSNGTQWMEITSGTGWGDTVSATSLVLTTWGYESSVATFPI